MGGASSLLATLAQSVPVNQGCALTSAAPFARQPNRLDRSACRLQGLLQICYVKADMCRSLWKHLEHHVSVCCRAYASHLQSLHVSHLKKLPYEVTGCYREM